MEKDINEYTFSLVNEVIDKTESGKRPLYTRKDVYKSKEGHWYKK